jgi:hypothetical protein
MMMAANLVGFVIGTDGMKYLAGELLGTLEGKSSPIRVERQCLRRSFQVFASFSLQVVLFLSGFN